MPFHVYVLENEKGRYYVGQTADLNARVERHNAPGDPWAYTPKHGPWRLVWSEAHPDQASAMRRERFIKSRKSAAWIRRYLLNR